MTSRAACSLIALTVAALGCLGKSDDSTTNPAAALDCPQLLGMRLVEPDGSRGWKAVAEWSANDDVDTLLVVVAPDQARSTRRLLVEVGIRPVRLADDVADTTLRYETIANVAIHELTPRGDSRLVWRARPSALDSVAGIKGDERVLRVRASVQESGKRACAATVELLPAM